MGHVQAYPISTVRKIARGSSDHSGQAAQSGHGDAAVKACVMRSLEDLGWFNGR